MKGFSSHMGSTLFEDCVSVGPVSDLDVRRLGALTMIEVFDDDDDDAEAKQGGLGSEILERKTVKAPVSVPTKTGVNPVFADEETPADVVFEAKKIIDLTDEDKALADLEDAIEETAEVMAAEEIKTFTAEELGEVADDAGINGLRKIAEPLGAKSNSIDGLIKEILHRQSNPKIVN